MKKFIAKLVMTVPLYSDVWGIGSLQIGDSPDNKTTKEEHGGTVNTSNGQAEAA